MIIFIQRFLIPIIGILVITVTFHWTISRLNTIVLGLFLFSPFLFALRKRTFLWFGIIIFSGLASLYIPGISQNFILRDILTFLFLCLATFPFLLGKLSFPPAFAISRAFAIAYIFVLIIHAVTRGIGIRSLGGESYGGTAYIRAILASGMVLAAGSIHATGPSWKKFLVFYAIGLTIPGAAQLLYIFSSGAIHQQYYFIRFENWALIESLRASMADTGIVRYHFLQGFSQSILVLAMVFAHSKMFIFLFLLSLPPVLLSGFRASIVLNLVWVFLFGFFNENKSKLKMIFKYCSALILLMALCLPIASRLPASMQRTLAAIPFLRVSDEARTDANGTLDWRLQIWKLAARNIPEYMVIGRGLTFSSKTFETLDASYLISPEYAYENHNYHNGPLACLIDLGIPGFFCILGFFLVSSIEVIRLIPVFKHDILLRPIFMSFLSLYIAQILYFLFAYGDLFTNLPNIMYHFALLIALFQSVTARPTSIQQSSTVDSTP